MRPYRDILTASDVATLARNLLEAINQKSNQVPIAPRLRATRRPFPVRVQPSGRPGHIAGLCFAVCRHVCALTGSANEPLYVGLMCRCVGLALNIKGNRAGRGADLELKDGTEYA